MSMVDLNNKTILVTGAAGFIGSNLVKRIYQETTSATVIGIGLRFHSWQKGKSVQLLTFRTQKVHITVAGHRSLCI